MMQAIRSSLAASRRWLRSVGPERAHLRGDILAGLPGAISSVPDGMAAAVLAGVNPVQGQLCELRRAGRRRARREHPADGDHDESAAALAAGSALQNVPADSDRKQFRCS
jgi:SulP family sulfate permease